MVLSLLGLFLAPSAWGDSGKITSAIDTASGSCKVVSQRIHEWKELGQQEFKSSAFLREELKKLGYTVTGDLSVPEDLIKGGIAKTAFRAELKGKGPGPTITIMLEYDALAMAEVQTRNYLAISASATPYSRLKIHEHGSPEKARPECGCGDEVFRVQGIPTDLLGFYFSNHHMMQGSRSV